MKRDGDHLWPIITATVRPFPGRTAIPLPSVHGQGRPKGRMGKAEPPSTFRGDPHTPTRLASGPSAGPVKAREGRHVARPLEAIEPGRFHHLTKGRAPSAPSIDLHNLNQDRARAALTAYLLRAHAEGQRAVLVITGKGVQGDGVLRRRTPEWLAEPPLRPIVAGISEAHQKHGGQGALYVALKRR